MDLLSGQTTMSSASIRFGIPRLDLAIEKAKWSFCWDATWERSEKSKEG